MLSQNWKQEQEPVKLEQKLGELKIKEGSTKDEGASNKQPADSDRKEDSREENHAKEVEKIGKIESNLKGLRPELELCKQKLDELKE